MAPNVKYISSHGSRPPNVPKYFILHTNGASKAGYDLSSYINQQLAAGNTSVTQPHFQVPLDGTCFRYLDDNEKGVASYRVEGQCLSAETGDYGYLHSDINTQAWTPEQIMCLAERVAEAHKIWGIPLRKPIHPLTDGGVGAHTMWPDNVYGALGEGTYGHHFLNGKRVLTNNPWTTNVGKICPGTTRKNQVQEIIDLAKTLVGPTPVEEEMLTLIQDTNGIFVTNDMVTYRAVAPDDINMFAINSLIKMNPDGTAPTVKLTDHRNRMTDVSPQAVNDRMAFIINSIVAKIPTTGSITPEQIQSIVNGVLAGMPKKGTYTIG